jgi:hypothetical protein
VRMKKNQRENDRFRFHSHADFVPGAGLEPALPQRKQDFKSCVSTDFTTRAIDRAQM